MSATRPMLEALLARVQKRAAERRMGTVEAVSPAAAAPVAAPRFEVPAPSAMAYADSAEEEIEEYEEELIEVIEDGDVESDEPVESAPPEPSPLELSVSAPSVEMRRRVVAPSPVPERGPQEALAAEAVERRPVTADVAYSHGSRPDLKRASFVDLLDASLELGR